MSEKLDKLLYTAQYLPLVCSSSFDPMDELMKGTDKISLFIPVILSLYHLVYDDVALISCLEPFPSLLQLALLLAMLRSALR